MIIIVDVLHWQREFCVFAGQEEVKENWIEIRRGRTSIIHQLVHIETLKKKNEHKMCLKVTRSLAPTTIQYPPTVHTFYKIISVYNSLISLNSSCHQLLSCNR